MHMLHIEPTAVSIPPTPKAQPRLGSGGTSSKNVWCSPTDCTRLLVVQEPLTASLPGLQPIQFPSQATSPSGAWFKNIEG